MRHKHNSASKLPTSRMTGETLRGRETERKREKERERERARNNHDVHTIFTPVVQKLREHKPTFENKRGSRKIKNA